MNPADDMGTRDVRAAEIPVPCAELEETLAIFTGRLGFRIASVLPADSPRVVVIEGHGVRLRLERDLVGRPCALRLTCADASIAEEWTAPNGMHVELVPYEPPPVVPANQPEFFVHRANDAWITGRAGMRYRDLIPRRYGGRFIASHINIANGGPVPDYVHFHDVRFQVIYCHTGWVRLVYEDQGPPFVVQAGDCVLQPPKIRHRVIECSPGLSVIEAACPAEHVTHADADMELPTPRVRADRVFGGQRFVHHTAAAASWQPWHSRGFSCRDTGIGAATAGLAGVRTVRRTGEEHGPQPWSNDAAAELLFYFVLRGSMTLRTVGAGSAMDEHALQAGDCFGIPGAMCHGLADTSPDLELLEIAAPALA